MSSVAQSDEIRMANEIFFQCLMTPGMEKKAQEGADEFVRFRVREDGWMRKVLPPTPIKNSELVPRIVSDKPYAIGEREPDAPPAYNVPFGTSPVNFYIRGHRFPINFQRLMTPRHVKDVSELATYQYDIRQVFSDNSLKNLLEQEDTTFKEASDIAIGGAADSLGPQTGVVQWETIPGGISRDTYNDALAIMPKNQTHLKAQTALINNVTIHEFMKWGRDEWGGDISEDIAKNGWVLVKILGVDVWVTIKRQLVPDNSMYMFADPKYLGRFKTRQDVTMYVKVEAFMLEFFSYEEIGATIANSGAITRADFI